MPAGYDPLNPQPYTPPEIPQQQAMPGTDPMPAKPSPFGGQPGYQFKPEAISHGGAIAGIADNVLRGIVNGHAQGEAYKALKLKKKSDDLNASYQSDAQRLWQVAQNQYQTTGKVDPNSDEYKAAKSAVDGSWGALHDFRGQLLEQQGGGKKKGGKKQEQELPPQAVLTNPNASPEEKMKAIYAVSGKLGAPVYGQVAQFNTPRAQQAWHAQQQGAETDEAKAATEHTLTTMQRDIADLSAKDKPTPEEITKLGDLQEKYVKLRETLNPTKMTSQDRKRFSEDGKFTYMVDSGGDEISGTRHPVSAPAKAPAVGTFGDFMAAAYGAKPSAKQYAEGRAAWTKAGAGTTTGTHEIPVPQPDGSIKIVQVNTSSTKSFAGADNLPSTRQDGAAAPSSDAPTVVTQSFAGKKVPGLVEQGNVDITKRPNIDNGDGSHSSVFSMSFGTDKGETLVPGVGDGKTYPARQLRVLYTLPNGTQQWAVPGTQPRDWKQPERPTPQNNEALDQYQKTGANFGTFKTYQQADAYAKTLHQDQAKYGNAPSSGPTRRQRPTAQSSAPSAAQSASSSPRSGIARPGDTIGGRLTPVQAKADEDVVAATKTNSLAVQALQSNEPGQQRQLALALIKGMAGRVNMQEYVMYTQKYGLKNTVDGMIEGIQSGKFPPAVVHQLARDAYANLQAAKEAQKVAYGKSPNAPKSVKAPKVAPQGASSEVYDKDGKTLIGHIVNNKYVALDQ